mgnify:CR=1 FL=1
MDNAKKALKTVEILAFSVPFPLVKEKKYNKFKFC